MLPQQWQGHIAAAGCSACSPVGVVWVVWPRKCVAGVYSCRNRAEHGIAVYTVGGASSGCTADRLLLAVHWLVHTVC